MAHECRCHSDTTEPIRADQTVGDVAHHRAGAREIMAGLGINHCCGAHLTLSAAAASAGVPLLALLAALNRGAPAPRAECPRATAADRLVLDVRGLEPPQPMLRVLETLERLGAGVELEMRHDRRPIFLYRSSRNAASPTRPTSPSRAWFAS
jgi:hypothetical protein